jgi:hypothetical protein
MRIPFEIVDAKVDQILSLFSEEPDDKVSDIIGEAEEFIEACGWTVDEFDLRKKYGILN